MLIYMSLFFNFGTLLYGCITINKIRLFTGIDPLTLMRLAVRLYVRRRLIRSPRSWFSEDTRQYRQNALLIKDIIYVMISGAAAIATAGLGWAAISLHSDVLQAAVGTASCALLLTTLMIYTNAKTHMRLQHWYSAPEKIPASYTYEQCVIYEVMREAISACCGAYTYRIAQERKKERPDLNRVGFWRDEIKELFRFRDSIMITDVRAVIQAIEKYTKLSDALSRENKGVVRRLKRSA